MHYFNEFNPHAAAWLRELIRTGVLPPGEVDERDIREVRADDLRGFTSCHFFAGIGGWDEALRLAGWPVDRPVWTGSCPCQPYSTAGKGLGDADPRNLWPAFFRLIRECRPDTVFGEQVEGAIKHGWLDRVQADLEGEGYAVGHCVLGAHSVGAPHIRQRLYWVADAEGAGRRANTGTVRSGTAEGLRGEKGQNGWRAGEQAGRFGDSSTVGESARGVFHPTGDGRGEGRAEPVGRGTAGGCGDGVGRVGDADRRRRGQHVQPDGHTPPHPADGDSPRTDADGSGTTGGTAAGVALGDAGGAGLPAPERQTLHGTGRGEEGRAAQQPGGAFWSDYELLPCRDGKARRTQPGLFPLAHGVSGRVAVVCPGQQPAAANEGGEGGEGGEGVRWVNRVGALRGAGNAIVPQVAAEFVAAFLEVEGGVK